MNRHAIVPALALLLSATASAAIDPGLLDLVMPEAKSLYGIRVRQALTSRFGEYALAHVPGAEALTRFGAATGFEMQRDLEEVLIARLDTGNPSDGSDALVLARGTFDPVRFTALATLTGGAVSDYHGVSITITPDRTRAFAFVDSSRVALGSESAIRSLIDRRVSQTVFSGPLREKTQKADSTADAWFAAITPLANWAPALPSAGGFDPATLLNSVIESWAELHFDNLGVTIYAEALTHSDAEAQGLAGILKVASGLVKGTRAAAFGNAQVTTTGPVTRITLTVAEPDLERSFPVTPRPRASR